VGHTLQYMLPSCTCTSLRMKTSRSYFVSIGLSNFKSLSNFNGTIQVERSPQKLQMWPFLKHKLPHQSGTMCNAKHDQSLVAMPDYEWQNCLQRLYMPVNIMRSTSAAALHPFNERHSRCGHCAQVRCKQRLC